MFRTLVPMVVAISFVFGCASAGTKPGDMTAPRHEAAAVAADKQGVGHDRQYDPNASAQGPCSPYDQSLCLTPSSCWNPTEPHREQGTQYRRLAEKHRAAAETLRAAEANACAGVPEVERRASPFRRREDIERVETMETRNLGRVARLGARVVLREEAGASPEQLRRLQDLIDCHLAHRTATGAEDSALPMCPLAVKGVTAEVKAAGRNLVVEILAKDEETGATVIANAQTLVADRAGAAGGP